ncbi:MAG TPA: amidohydrolase family protein [Geminicoccaceae bacterium]
MTDHLRGELPVKVDPTSNGEYRPVPLESYLERANVLAAERIREHARRVGQGRRAFLQSVCGAATTLWTLNEAFAARGNTGGHYRLSREAPFETAAAEATLAGDEFIFDVQTHMVDPAGKWRSNAGQYWERILASFPQGSCGDRDPVDCFSAEQFIKHVFMDSDTDLAVLSFVPELPENNPLSLEEAERVRVLVERMEGAHRLFLHAMVVPNAGPEIAPLELMGEAARRYPIAAWKCYTQWGPDGVGWELDSPEVGIPFIERARELGVHNICIHKGLLFSGFPEQYGRCHDVGRAARLYPDMNFIIYHSGFETGHAEGPYDPSSTARGIDTLIRSLEDNGIGPGGNVYAELGSTWRFVMRDPTTAAHLLGKLLTHVGEENVLWGTDSIWYGSPQDQIQAFRSFQIADELLERHGYPELTAELKAKVFGLNGAKVYGVEIPAQRQKTETDPIQKRRATYEPDPTFETFGPRTDREYDALAAERGGLPA